MPKNRRVPSLSSDGSRASPYHRGSKNNEQRKSENLYPSVGDEKEWEEVRCPICMEHPHNAVLLRCSSHSRGCRPYMCDTSYRHSNCLDQFRKSSSAIPSKDISCPLCRGQVHGWIIVDPARLFMNSKPRSCSLETCDFSGTYSELRKHARLNHPSVRPTDADSGRQCDWNRLERERDLEDFLSAFQLEPRRHWIDPLEFEGGIEDSNINASELEFGEDEIDGPILELERPSDINWPGLEAPSDDLSTIFEPDTDLDVDIGIELPFSFFDTIFSFGPLAESSVRTGSGVSGRRRPPNRITASNH